MIVVFSIGFIIPHIISYGWPFGFDIGFVALGFMLLGYLTKRFFDYVDGVDERLIVAYIAIALLLVCIVQRLFLPIQSISMHEGDYGNIVSFLVNAILGSYTIFLIAILVEHSKAGARPSELTVKHWDVELTECVDYTVVCKNNNKLTEDATLVVKGKGRYVGESKTFHYSVVKKSIVLSGNRAIKMTVPDKVAKPNKAGVYLSTPILTDNGKKLGNSDFDTRGIKYCYVIETGKSLRIGDRSVNDVEVKNTDIIPAGATIKIVVPAKEGSNYTGNAEKSYRVVEQDISKASVGKITRYYTGEEIEFKNAEDFEDLKVTIKGVTKPLKYGEDYEIVPESYEKNINKGTAKVTIEGKSNYGGTKTVSFTIATRNITSTK